MFNLSQIRGNKRLILNKVCDYLFKTNKSSNGNKVFDIYQDFKYYYADFKKMGIDLNTDNLGWWEFQSLLESFMLNDNSTISKVISYRTYKKPPKSQREQEQLRHKFMMSMKRRYALESEENVESGLEKLWQYLTSKKGE